MKDTYCSHCGTAFLPYIPYPKACSACRQITYDIAPTVVVGVVPVNDGEGLLAVRRGIEPHKGLLALPSGYKGSSETWEAALVREIEEETGIRISEKAVSFFDVRNASNGATLLFGWCGPIRVTEPLTFTCEETQEVVVLREPTELAFPLHTEMERLFWGRRWPKPTA